MSSTSQQSTVIMSSQSPSPPLANKVEHKMELFGDVRVDYYNWFRNDSRKISQVISHLKQENDHTEAIMSGTKKHEEEIFEEMEEKIKEDGVNIGSTLEGKEYVQHCRYLVPNCSASPSVHDTMPTGPDAPVERAIMDENVTAQVHGCSSVAAQKVSPNNQLVALAIDNKGDEIYRVFVINKETKASVGKPLERVSCDFQWAGNEALVYITKDEVLRPYKVWLRKVGLVRSNDVCLYHEKDDMFSLHLRASESGKFLFVRSESKTTSSVWYLEVSKPDDELSVLTPRMPGIDTAVSHRGNHFFILWRSDESFNSELLTCPLENTSKITPLIPHRPSVKIQDIQLFRDHLVLYEREGGLPKITTFRLSAVEEPTISLQGRQAVQFIVDEPAYSVGRAKSQFSSTILRYSYSSLRMPLSLYYCDMDDGESKLIKTETVGGGFDASNYVTERQWALASDGQWIPISIVYQRNLVKLDGSNPMLLHGYGSYETCEDPHFSASRLSLLDRGFIYAIAHIRGGGEMGRQWYEDGKLLKKQNTFTDFITCAEFLIEKKYCSKEKLCVEGSSAGGLLIGAVLNMRPDLFKAAVAEVPFLDVLTTMLDPTIPLTTLEWEEWGDPREEEFYFYIKSYSPVDNVKAQNYPNILVTARFHDSRVMYSEPAKFVAKLRDMKTDDNMLLFKCEFDAGHLPKPGRFERLKKDAFTYTFILKALNMIPTSGSTQN